MRVSLYRAGVLCLAVAACFLTAAAASDNIAALKRSFEHPPDDARIMMRWWWFGPAVAKPELERELRAMKAGGIGGVEVQPVYPSPDDLDAATSRISPTSSSTTCASPPKRLASWACAWI